MPTAEEEIAKVQLTGVLCKRPVNVTSQTTGGYLANKWSRRFFVVKDGFLMYYNEAEKREFERRKCANYHPKGLMPLGDCLITRMQEPEVPHMISIVNELSLERLVIQCENSWEQEKWMDALEKASRICYRNAQLGDTLIQQLQIQGAKLAEEKQEAYLKLHDETEALSNEKTKMQEMERLMEAMSDEKLKLEQASEDLYTQFEQVKAELDLTAKAMKEVEAEKVKLSEQQSELSTQLTSLEEQKAQTEEQLKDTQHKSLLLEDQNQQLSSASEQTRAELAEQIQAEQKTKLDLEKSLKQIEEEMTKIKLDKERAENKAREQQELAKLLQDEKVLFHEEARELEKNLSDIKHQKEMTEAELKEEVKARLKAEQRLHEAENALQNLEKRLTQEVVTEEEKLQLLMNVKALRRYFEQRILEHKFEADKPLIMKRAVYNNRRNMRAKSVKLIRRSEHDVSDEESPDESLVDPSNPASTARLRNSASAVLKDRELRAFISRSAHSIGQSDSE